MRESKGQKIEGETKPLILIRVIDVETRIGGGGREALVTVVVVVVVVRRPKGDEVKRGTDGDEVNEERG